MKPILIKLAAEFFKIPEEEAIIRVEKSTQLLANEWNENKSSIEDYYKQTDNYIFDLIKYNTDNRIYTTIYPIMHFENKTILDFGGGIGEISRVLSSYNKVFYYDLPSKTQEFAKYVTKKENKDVTFLTKEELNNYKFKIIIAVDVFEHLENPIETLELLDNLLETNGCLLTTGLDFNTDSLHPQHLVENLIKKQEFTKILMNRYVLFFFHVSKFGNIYLWRKN